MEIPDFDIFAEYLFGVKQLVKSKLQKAPGDIIRFAARFLEKNYSGFPMKITFKFLTYSAVFG